MGIFDWVTSQTGIWGPALLEFYFRNAGWINSLVLAYGLLLLLSWQNLSRILDALVDQVLDQAGNMPRAASSGDKHRPIKLEAFKLSWERAFAVSKFPFVASQTGFIIHRSTVENVRGLISERELFQRCSRGLKKFGFSLEKSNS